MCGNLTTISAVRYHMPVQLKKKYSLNLLDDPVNKHWELQNIKTFTTFK